MMEKTKVRVVVRVRPSFQQDEKTWVNVLNDTTLQTFNHRNTNETLQYDFPAVYGPDSTQRAIFMDCVKPQIENVLNGKNASIFAYGPTGAGKTYTVLGTVKEPGLISRCVRELFEVVQENTENDEWETNVSLSYLEIYNEKVKDLLNTKLTDLPIREDGHKNIFVSGITEKKITNVEEFNEYFGQASSNRTTASTKLNEHSSRSHSILLLKVQRRQMKAPHRRLTGKMYLIDLAGSEDNRRTGNQGVRLKESGAINSSLLALGQVVDALNKGQSCIPYRGSKLTRLLQDSLGGSAVACMIVNLAPEEQYYFDTYTTLNFARKTKKIVNVVRTNESFDRPAIKVGSKRSSSVSSSGSPTKKKKVPTATLR